MNLRISLSRLFGDTMLISLSWVDLITPYENSALWSSGVWGQSPGWCRFGVPRSWSLFTALHLCGAVFAMSEMSVCPSVCQMRELW